ncbi:putative acetyl/propionyl-CoA carboxylase alpha subunit [Janibacter sp. HTCC2649]|nr:putative acetyl/propionyl-CoA carboxylase alpha subunit [Janibacter sp. HTCC2649]
MISTLLVANRGEIARRIFATCRTLGIRTVAVHSDADAGAPFVGEADTAVGMPGSAPADTYLRGDLVIAAALASGADAIHPGYGFLSESGEFARAVEAAGLIWVGPTPDAIDSMGSKTRAKEIMAAAGVPILSVDIDALEDSDFPLLVKASSGGGGRGMRVVTEAGRLAGELDAASAEAAAAFGDGAVFVEPYLPTARHIEVQVLADAHGTGWVLGDRDCSIQRRHQKVVEEAPAPRVSDEVRSTLHAAALAAAKAIGYVGAGTVEFLVRDAHLDSGEAYFLEMNTRLQVEHPVTEAVSGVDLVALQIAVAEGTALDPEPPAAVGGHAIEVRLYAEDPADDWRAQTGTVRTFALDGATTFGAGAAQRNSPAYGIRLDSAIESGSEVGVHYDAMIAKVIAHAPTRTAAARMLRDALRRSRIHGVKTNAAMLRQILADEAFLAGEVHTALLGERLDAWTVAGVDEDAVRRYALAAALAQASTATAQARVLRSVPTAFRNVPSQARTRSFRHGGEVVTASYRAGRAGLEAVGLDDVVVRSAGPDAVVLAHGGVEETYRVAVGADFVDVDGPLGSVSFDTVPRFTDPADDVKEGSLLAPMPAVVVQVAVDEGQSVSKGDVIAVLEAMKMQHTITASADGVVTDVRMSVGAQVASGAVLAVLVTATSDTSEAADAGDPA